MTIQEIKAAIATLNSLLPYENDQDIYDAYVCSILALQRVLKEGEICE